ncbi:MAG TPA: hypothetical protein ENK16_00300 [Chromatiales bacterium]|nr:hypothetical protein [Chromatiales bacterium]
MPEYSSSSGTDVSRRITSGLSVLLWLAIIAVPWFSRPPGMPSSQSGLAAPLLDACVADRPDEPAGFLRGQLYGDLKRSINSHAPELHCGGGLRPDGQGIRLVLAPTGQQLLFVLGFGKLPDTDAAGEQAVNLTIIDERSGRFYNSGTTERCWVRLGRFRERQQDHRYELAGELYCAGALSAVNSAGFVTPGDFVFAGHFIADPE